MAPCHRDLWFRPAARKGAVKECVVAQEYWLNHGRLKTWDFMSLKDWAFSIQVFVIVDFIQHQRYGLTGRDQWCTVIEN